MPYAQSLRRDYNGFFQTGHLKKMLNFTKLRAAGCFLVTALLKTRNDQIWDHSEAGGKLRSCFHGRMVQVFQTVTGKSTVNSGIFETDTKKGEKNILNHYKKLCWIIRNYIYGLQNKYFRALIAEYRRTENCWPSLTEVNKALRHEEPDRIPSATFFWEDCIRRWRKGLICLQIQILMIIMIWTS